MSAESDRRSHEFLKVSDQFKLGVLTTEGSHPITERLSQVAAQDIPNALGLLFQVDSDVVDTFARFVASGRAIPLRNAVLESVRQGGRLFFTGCGSTGRLSIQLVSIWREFWHRYADNPTAAAWEQQAHSVMAGGDFALIKSVEGFEDYTSFGRAQITDLGVRPGDLVFAITEGGETSFVIGTAWAGLERGARVCFVYNNPDDVLCTHVQRSREVIQEPRIEKLNLTTGPMAITGSTRMQATSIQLCVLLTVMEMVCRELLPTVDARTPRLDSNSVPHQFLNALRTMHAELCSPRVREELAQMVQLEENVYRRGGRVNYFADAWAIDILTDTTERSPTYCTPPFRKADDPSAAESWAFLFVPRSTTSDAWHSILRRGTSCVEWPLAKIQSMLEPAPAARSYEVIKGISSAELLRFKVGLDGLSHRPLREGDAMIVVGGDAEVNRLLGEGRALSGEFRRALELRAGVGAIVLGPAKPVSLPVINPAIRTAFLQVPRNDFLLDPVSRVGLKLLMNALSTCTMVRLGRVLGNYMVWVVPSNLKLIDRATRYIHRLSGLAYEESNRLLFEVIEYIEPRMRAGKAYPPAVAMAVTRAERHVDNETAEALLSQGKARV